MSETEARSPAGIAVRFDPAARDRVERIAAPEHRTAGGEGSAILHGWRETISDPLAQQSGAASIHGFRTPGIAPRSALIPGSELPLSINTPKVDNT
jgi:hypothetical protein